MSLVCGECGAADLDVTDQYYGENRALDAYQCLNCGATGAHVSEVVGMSMLHVEGAAEVESR